MQTIALNKLSVSEKYNVRTTNREVGLEELSSSILSHGLLENLLVTKGENDNFEVVAGGRRYSALKSLQRQGYLPDDYVVPCEIVAEENATEISLAENTVRLNMHPADQYEAWARLIANGLNIRDIALRFGVSEKLVTQRLKLGNVSPNLMKAYREEVINLESLMAFTITDDTAKQEELFNNIKDSWMLNRPSSIRNALTETSLNSKDKLVKFVGEEEYKRAGGSFILQDLFSENDGNYFDKELITTLAMSKLEDKAAEFKDKWSWVEINPVFDGEYRARFHIIRPQIIGEIPQGLQDRYEEVEAMLDEIDTSDEEYEEYDTLRAEKEHLEDKVSEYNGYTEEQYALAGCVVSIGGNGDFAIYEGLVKPEDYKKIQKDNTDTPVVKEKQRYSTPLMERLKNYRLHSVRMAMANDFATAFDSALYVMCIDRFKPGYSSTAWLNTKATEYHYPMSIFEKDDTGESIKKQEDKFFKKLPLAWLKVEGDKERFAALCALDEKQKQKLFAACIAKSLKPQLSIEKNASPIFEGIFERMGVEVAKDVRPNADNFFNRVTKAELLEIGQEIFGSAWVNHNQPKPKGDIVTILNRAFENPEHKSHTKEQREKLNTWLPDGM